MNSRIWKDVSVFAALVTLGVATRLVPYATSLGSWNFNAIGAIALFAGFYFRNYVVALAAAGLPMLVGDAIIGYCNYGGTQVGQYPIQELAANYVFLLAPVFLGPWLRTRFHALSIGAAAIGSAVFFFIGSNFVYWLCNEPLTTSALVASFVKAVPFFRGTFIGNLLFAALFFGTYALVSGRAAVTEAKPQTEPAAV